jgi:hypothetical protein
MSDTNATSTARSDGWCGSCGAVFTDRPETAEFANCDACGLSLKIPEGGPAKVVENFKAEFIKDGGIVLGAWFDEGSKFLVVYVDPMRLSDEGVQEELLKVPAPGEYQGLPTVLTLFPREQQ